MYDRKSTQTDLAFVRLSGDSVLARTSFRLQPSELRKRSRLRRVGLWHRNTFVGVLTYYSLAPEDFQTVLKISSSFRTCGAPPTTFGKALHFFLPETVMLWEQAIVGNTYKPRPDPDSFVSYQRFGWKLLHHVTRGKTVKVLRQLETDHARSIGYFEPMTMILDHLAFSSKLSARAVATLGGSSQAFSDDLR